MDMEMWLVDTRRRVDEWIQDEWWVEKPREGSVEEAMAYSLTAGGKRLRAQLVLASAAYLGEDSARFRGAVLAVEYLHTYSLIHDDLPAMDDDDLRRGRPTNHKMFGEARAILAGDALLTESFLHLSQLVERGFAPSGVVAAIRLLATAGGSKGLVRGQVLDLAGEHQELSLNELEEVHRLKTGALFEASVAIPAVLLEKTVEARQLKAFGHHFGMAFQIVDDILNVVGDRSLLGKSTGTDLMLGKATYPRLLGLDEAYRLAGWHREQALEALEGGDIGVLEGLLAFAVNRQW